MRLTRALGWRMGVLIAITGLALTILGVRALLDRPENMVLRSTSLASAVFVLVLGLTLIWRGWRGTQTTD